MAQSSSYSKRPLEDSDIFFGSKFSTNRTVNYAAYAVVDYFNSNAKINIFGQLSYKFLTSTYGASSIFFQAGGGNNTSFSSITEIIVSQNDLKNVPTNNFLSYLINSDIVIAKQGEHDVFGHYKLLDVTLDIPGFYKLTLEYIGGFGSIENEAIYSVANFAIGGGSATIPTLQEVTNQGNTTTNNVISSGGFYYQGLDGKYISLFDGGFYLNTSGSGFSHLDLRSDNLTFVRTQQVQDKDGTFAYLDDIPGLQNLQQTMELGNSYNQTIGDYSYTLQFDEGANNFIAYVGNNVTSTVSYVTVNPNESRLETVSPTSAAGNINSLGEGATLVTQSPNGINKVIVPIRTSGSISDQANFEVQNNKPAGTYQLATLDDITTPTLQQVMEVGRSYIETVDDFTYTLDFFSDTLFLNVADSTLNTIYGIQLSQEAQLYYYDITQDKVSTVITGVGGVELRSDLASLGANVLRIPFKTSGSGEVIFQVQNNLPAGTYELATLDDIPSLSGYVPTSRTLTINGTTYDLTADRSWTIAANTSGSFGASFDGMGSIVLINSRAFFRMQRAGVITEWSIVAEGTSPTATFDVWRIASGTALPTVANTIFGTKPALSTGNAITSTTMTGWTTSFNANDIFCINVDACANATELQLLFKVTYS